MSAAQTILEVRGLRKHFPIRGGLFNRNAGTVRAVDDVSFSIARGETLSLVGESGCGKTTTSRCILRAIALTGGEIIFRGETGADDRRCQAAAQGIAPTAAADADDLPGSVLLAQSAHDDRRDHRRTAAGERHARHCRAQCPRRRSCWNWCTCRSAYLNRFPHAFSGGQRQRIGIARALALNPALIVADEPVSALDVSVQAQIVNLLLELQDRLGLAYLFVAHDLSVVKHVSHRVAVMYAGRIVEIAPTEALFITPRHPYTEALLSAVPVPDPRQRAKRIVLEGDVADPSNPPTGCHFHPRCRYATEACRQVVPELAEVTPGHAVRCLRAADLSLTGVTAPA